MITYPGLLKSFRLVEVEMIGKLDFLAWCKFELKYVIGAKFFNFLKSFM